MKSTLKSLIVFFTAIVIISSCQKENPSFLLTVSVNPSEAGTAIGGGTYKAGEQVNLTATENAGYQFLNWTKNGIEVSTDINYLYTTSAENATLTANFEQLTYTLTVELNLINSGTVTGGGTYPAMQAVNLSATPGIGYTFANWTVGDTEVSTNPNYTYTTVTDNVTIKANFVEKQLIITLGAQSNATTGAFYSLGNDLVYNQELAFANQDTIDMMCFYEHDVVINDITLTSPGANITGIYGGSSTDPINWTIKRTTLYTPPANAISTSEFDLLHQNDPAIKTYFNSTMTSGIKKAKLLVADNIYAFKTKNDIYGLFKVISVVQGVDGSVEFEIKLTK